MVKLFRVSLVLLLLVTNTCIDAQDETSDEKIWLKEFDLADRNLVSTGKNDFFLLQPGFQVTLEGYVGKKEKTFEKLVITVLEETKEVEGVITRVVEEREWKNNKLYEVSRNYYAIDSVTNDVFYFGEEVDFYKDNKVINHKGAWIAGVEDAIAGLIMPGKPEIGLKYYQEFAPGVAMDRAEIISINEVLETPAGTFTNCLKTMEGTALNSNVKEYKTYAAGIGLIQDETLLLTGFGFINK